ncbi:MAG TPA: neuraminidase-like domain-containing protein [Candidatus Limnocylindrales bacterium]
MAAASRTPEVNVDSPLRRLGPRASGDDVRMLHGALLRLGAAIDPGELSDRRFGTSTAEAVRAFQRDGSLHPSGVVDQATYEALRARLAETAEVSFVSGRVRWAGGEPAAGLTVRAFDRDLRHEQPLGEATTDDAGGYRIAYTRESFARSEKAAADLFVRVFTGDEDDPPRSATLFQAPELAIIDVTLTGKAQAPSEYERILAAVTPLLDGAELDGLRQDGEFQDITFLSGETGFAPEPLSHFAVAQRLSAAHRIDAGFFYALFARQTLLRTGLESAIGMRFAIDLSTDPQPLFYDIVLLDEAVIRGAVAAAIEENTVPATLGDELDRVLEILSAGREEARRYLREERPRALFARVQTLLSPEVYQPVFEALTREALQFQENLADLPRLFERIADLVPQPQNVVLADASLADVLGYDGEIIDRIRRHQGIERPEEVRRLARLNPRQWRAVLREASGDLRISGGPVNPELIDLHGSALARRLEARFPTTAFTSQLERDTALFGDRRGDIVEVLNDNPDFDLTTGNVQLLFKRRNAPAAAREALKSAQRVFKLAPTFRQTRALLDEGIESAAKIHGLGAKRFAAATTKTGQFTPEQADQVFRRAADVHVASVMLAGELQAAAGSMKVQVLGGDATAESLTAVTGDFPNLKTLFQLADYCYCEECRSVHSAAAYLADTLQFLKNRLVTDKDSPGPALKVAKDVLFQRRPDLGDLDLSCENTNTPVPYIDLVCELLEEAVAPDPGFAFAGPLTSGVDPVDTVSAPLLAALQGKGWAFTASALVYEADLSGARVVRDKDISAKLVPDGGDWRVYRLRQTVGSAAELAAAPQYVNAAAYTALAASNYAFELPFDLSHQETRSYFKQFDIERAELMRALQIPAGPSDFAIAAEELGLSEAQRPLIVTANPGAQAQIWNTAPLTTEGGIARLDNFLGRAQLDYRRLEELLALAWINPGDTMFIKHLDNGCELSHKTLENLDNPALDRLHRFLRLLRAPGVAEAGWTPPLLDRAIRAAKLGNSAIDNLFLVRLAQLHQLRRRLGLSLGDLINLYEPLDERRYAQVFLNEPANGQVEQDFQPAAVLANEAAETATPGSGIKLSAHLPYLATCLGITTADAAELTQGLGAAAIISFANLGTVYAATILMRSLRLSATELTDMRVLTGADPLASPSATLLFAQRLAPVTAAGIRPADLRYLLRHEASDLAARELPDAVAAQILASLQSGYQAAFAQTRAEIDPAAPPEEQKPGLRTLLSTVPEVSEPDLAAFESIVDGEFTDPVLTAEQFIDAKLAALVDTTAIKATLVASPTPVQQTATILAIATALTEHFYGQAKQDLARQAVATAFGLSDDATATVLAQAELGGDTLLSLLTDDATTPAAVDMQYRALRLLHVLAELLERLSIPDDRLSWVLARAADLGWLAPDALPYQTGVPAVSLDSWAHLSESMALFKGYPPVANPIETAPAWSADGLFDLVLAPGTTAAQVHEYLAQLAGLDKTALADLDAHLGLSAVDISGYRLPSTITTLVRAAGLLRRLGLTPAKALPLAQPTTGATAAATMRQALKARYTEADWLPVLQGIQDRLREAKRDALVAYLLARHPLLRSSTDLYDFFLIDVEMQPCMPTSRIVQAHATVQLFVMRCLMGLEPHSVAATTEDPAWDQWKWMANFRVWEANRKVFLYPENWILPELRDDKSEIYLDVENELQQDELTELATENAAITYLERLDDLAHVDVMACYYQTDVHVMHVFARTKGGDPAVYYYRQFQQERYWTPWSRVPLDIAGEHLLAFDRNSRMTLAWPVFTEETETTESSTIPHPDDIPAGGKDTEKPKKRWKIQLAVGERAHGKWLPKKVSAGALYYPQSGYTDSLPGSERFHLFPVSVGDSAQTVSVLVDAVSVGSFMLTGCRGYPEPSQGSTGTMMLSPHFRETELLAERFAELTSRPLNDLAISTIFQAAYQTIVAQTPGRFRVTYPMQAALLDWILALLSVYLGGRGNYTQDTRRFRMPLGTFMPFFYGDYSRAYVIVPGFYERDPEDPDKRIQKTYADIDQLLRDILALLAKYLKMYLEDPAHDLQKVLTALVKDPEYQRIIAEITVYLKLSYGMKFDNFYHPLVCFLRIVLNRSGIPALMSRATQLKDTGFDFDATYQPEPVVVEPYPLENIDFESSGAYSGYNWELFFHLPFDIAMRCNRDQRFAEAQKWFHYIFNPVGTSDGAIPQKFWITKPFFETTAAGYLSQRINDIMYAVAADPSGASITDLKFAVSQWREKPFRPHVVARTRPVAYQLAIVNNYIKNLVDWGDQLFRQFTRESVTQATQLYLMAEKLLGPKPSVVPPLATPAPETFNQLEAKLDLFGNALLDLENLIPDLDLLPHGGDELPTPLSYSALYFCIPPNENLLKLWDVIADRLFKIRNCQNIDGVESILALFAPPIDPGALVRAAAAGLDISAFLAGLGAPLPNYRFMVMVGKAGELAAHVADLGSALLAALEKRDAEKLSRLQNSQSIALLAKVREVKLATITEAEGAIEALRLSLEVAKEKRSYYTSRPYMNAWEITSVALSGTSLAGEAAIAVGYILSGGLKLVPNFMTGGAGFGGSPTVTLTLGGDKLGAAVDSATMTLQALATALEKASAMAATQGGYQRRQDDWDHQAALAAHEMAEIDRQIVNAELHVEMLRKELAAHDREALNAQKVSEYLQSKYTGQELYEWMAGQASSVYFSAYKLAFDVAKKAERCYAHELGSDTTFLKLGYWDSLKKGLTVADALRHDINRMEVSYLDSNKRERELTKTVSLAQLDPAALIDLRATGKCVINVPEALFDLDHPGHYFRRLKSVSMSIPCVAGPHTSVSAKLSLVGNRYRKDTSARQGVATDKEKYQEVAGDERFVYNVGGIESIATSTGQSDGGVFELNFTDQRYLPFEGKGAIGTWRLELPWVFRQFDADTISDVLLHLRYTARDGGSTLRGLVEKSQRELLNEMLVDASNVGLFHAYSLRRDFPDQWWQLQQQQSTKLTIGLEHLPFLARGHQPVIDATVWYARVDTDPATYPVTIGAGPASVLNRDNDLDQCVGPSAPIVLGTPFTIAANPAGLTDLTLLIHYTLNA